jgi:hypothetical protein
MTRTDPGLLSLHILLASGRGELKVSPDHPVFAAFRRGMEEGQLTGTWRFLVATAQEISAPFIIGTFVETPNGRLLYFPGAQIEIAEASGTTRFDDARLDHLTLDSPKGSRYSSHIAVRDLPEERSRGLSYTALLTPGFLFPWFSLLVPSLDGFSVLPSRLYVEFPPPHPDLHRYADHLMANGGVVQIRLPSTRQYPAYYQFDVWVGHGTDWRTRRAQVLAWAYKPEIVADPPGRQDVQAGIGEAELREGVGLRVLTSRPLGRLLAPRILRPRWDPL